MKPRILAVAVLMSLAPLPALSAQATARTPADARVATTQQLWAAWGGSLEVRWNRDLAGDIGLRISAPAEALPGKSTRGRDRFEVRRSGSIEFHVENGYFRGFDGGSLQAAGGYTMTLPDGSAIDFMDFRLVPSKHDPLILDFVGKDGKAWFYIDRLMYELLDHDSVLSVGAMDMRISAELAKRIGHPEVAGWAIADLAMTTQVQTQGSGAMPLASSPHWPGTPAPNGGTWEADLFMKVFSMSYSRCQGCTGNAGSGKVVFTPSSTLQNNVNAGSINVTIPGQGDAGKSTALWAASISWNQKFSSPTAPYNNDQHPFLIWNMYRINANGTISQIGRSGVKHAWLTVNGSCLDPGDHDSHILGRGCTDTYGTGNNDTSSDLGPRSEIVPAAGIWGRCGSIYDPGCVGSSTASPNGSYDQRLIVGEKQISATRNPGATYLFESWYIARDDINPYNSMATVSGTPTWTGSTWAPGGSSNYKLGPAIDRWVDPVNPPANAKNSELSVGEGRAKVAVKVTNLGGGKWRYAYAVMNVDFARAVMSGSAPNIRVDSNKGFDGFSVAVGAGTHILGPGSDLGDVNPNVRWRAQVANDQVTFDTSTGSGIGSGSSAPGGAPPTLDWGTMYSFAFTATTPPTEGDATLHVAQAGSPESYSVTTLVPSAATVERSSR